MAEDRTAAQGRDAAILYLGSHHASARWWALGIPLFISVRVLRQRKSLPVAVASWALDSGGFTELDKFHRWETTEDEYVEEIERLSSIGSLAWVAPQDWMCEPFMLAKTGLSVREHQERTIASFLSLRERVGSLVIPMIQGYAPREYETHALPRRCLRSSRSPGSCRRIACGVSRSTSASVAWSSRSIRGRGGVSAGGCPVSRRVWRNKPDCEREA